MGSSTTTPTKRNNIIQFQTKPFAQGTFRIAFMGKIISGPDKGERAVIKAFKDKKIRRLNLKLAQKQHKSYACTNMYAKMFNQKLAENKISEKISVPQPDMVEVKLSLWQTIFGQYFQEKDNVSAQMYLPGQYIKWTNNAGYLNKQDIGINLMEAFQHFTYTKSNGDILCCDLQGVRKGNTYFLTDPAVISRQQIFGDTDLGMKYLKQILGRHKCNSICNKLGMTNYMYDSDLKPVTYSTSKEDHIHMGFDILLFLKFHYLFLSHEVSSYLLCKVMYSQSF